MEFFCSLNWSAPALIKVKKFQSFFFSFFFHFFFLAPFGNISKVNLKQKKSWNQDFFMKNESWTFQSISYQKTIRTQHDGVRTKSTPKILSNYPTVWPEPIWKKVSDWWQIPPEHQSTYLGGPESASIEITPFRPHFVKFSKTVF